MSSQPSSAAGEPSQAPEPNEFVSAVSWRSNSGVLLAANSQGHIKVSRTVLCCFSPIIIVHLIYNYAGPRDVLSCLWSVTCI